MCGLTGFSGKDGRVFDKSSIALLMFNNLSRGKDSTGFYTPENGVVKKAIAPDIFLKDFINGITPSTIFIGHNRFKTGTGIATNSGAHPFDIGNIIGAHNGVINNVEEICEKANLDADSYDVDSMAMFARLSHDNNPSVFPEINGAVATIYLSKLKPNSLYVIRNTERTLFRGEMPEGMYIASTEDGLSMIGCKNIKPFKEDTLYEISNGKIERHLRVLFKKNKFENSKYDTIKIWSDVNYYIQFMTGLNVRYDGTSSAYENMTYGTYYRIEDIVSSNYQHMNTMASFSLVDKKGTKRSIGASMFDLSSIKLLFKSGTFVRVGSEGVKYKGKEVLKPGMLCKITKPLNDFMLINRLITVRNLKTNEIWRIDPSYVEALTNHGEVINTAKKFDIKITPKLEKTNGLLDSKDHINNLERITKLLIAEHLNSPLEEEDIDALDTEKPYEPEVNNFTRLHDYLGKVAELLRNLSYQLPIDSVDQFKLQEFNKQNPLMMELVMDTYDKSTLIPDEK